MRKLLALLAFAAVASSSNESITDAGSVFGLDLDVTPPVDTLVVSTQVKLVATATRSGVPLLTLRGHVWETSNQAFAIVDQDGTVTGLYCWGSSLWGAIGNQVQAVAVTGPTKTQPPQ